MIKKRTRPQPRLRQPSLEVEDKDSEAQEDEGGEKLALADLIELRKLRRAREGIDIAKLSKGDVKKKKKRPREEDEGGLKPGASSSHHDPEEEDEEDRDARARRVVRANNFTQQTNVLDVDKHMMAYIEENMKLKRGSGDDSKKDDGPVDPLAEIFRRKALNEKEQEEGNVTNSMAMLTAIPEVDLGMDARLKNIEETEKAKRMVTEGRQERKKVADDEEQLAATRFYRPNLKTKSDAEILRDAKLEAMGLQPEEHHEPRRTHDRPQMATDEIVMERFKKRMRK
ncbi:hepatocellular carcinoma-associated antigen 59-domain-containing protein [Phanerochaete sordida]|uniref:Hepatocellular carcinoma-associated antigen 59-domain-containing protein n=1 Tax=Phanerochaete sordida TaxID=48140 RepID=A0A9P3FXT0_9APHY|nr:hepatocellular carcinoma-associated antigen 59-domain-containing protein [Phanerochaete sordida]